MNGVSPSDLALSASAASWGSSFPFSIWILLIVKDSLVFGSVWEEVPAGSVAAGAGGVGSGASRVVSGSRV